MQAIIDSNMLRSPVLETFMSLARRNRAILTDYSAMEMYKGDSIIAAPASMAILSRHPDQVIVLKGTSKIVQMRGRVAGLRRRLIDAGQTAGFGSFAKRVQEVPLSPSVADQLRTMGGVASAFFDRLLHEASEYPSIFKELSANFPPEDIAQFRKPSCYGADTVRRFIDVVNTTADLLFSGHPLVFHEPSDHERYNTFIFRYSLSSALLWRRWVQGGSQPNISPSKILNDMVDVNFCDLRDFL